MYVDRFWYANETVAVPPVWHYTAGVFSLLCLIFGLISNGLVIFAFIKNEALQRPRNYFLINLAITDLGLLLTNNSMHIISSFKKKWIFGQIGLRVNNNEFRHLLETPERDYLYILGCNFYSVCGGVFGLTSIATMASISLTRLAAVHDPFSSLKLSSHFTLSCLVCSWIYGSAWIMPPLFGWNRFILEGFGTSCTFDYISKDLWDRTFIFLLITGGFVIPLAIILVSYSFILMKLSERTRRFTPQNHDDQDHNSTYYFNQSNIPNEERCRSETATTLDCTADDNIMTRNIRRTEARATRTALLICAFFCSAWGPYALMALISLFGFDYLITAYTTAILGMFTKVAACINPLIYALALSGFREQICLYFKYMYRCDKEQQHHLIPLNHDQNRKTLPDTTASRQSDPMHRINIE